MIRIRYEVNGLKNNANTMTTESARYQVNINIEQRGATLSIGDLATGIQYSIPFDLMLKDISKEIMSK